MKKQLAMVVDASKPAWDCKGCMAACKVANQVPDGYWRNWVQASDDLRVRVPRRGKSMILFQPGGCMHCRPAHLA